MKIVPTESEDVRDRVYIRASSTDELVAYGNVDILPDDAPMQIQNILSAHPIERYPEGAYIGVFGSADLKSRRIRDPETIRAEPYPHGIELTAFPPKKISAITGSLGGLSATGIGFIEDDGLLERNHCTRG